ncbi:MAG: endopeptidase La [Candidatus Desulfofervidus auxilii]|nr:endopeptidase La [Candidatus Desulfofervidus auxilii]
MKFFKKSEEKQIPEIEELQKIINETQLPPNVREIAIQELERLSRMSPSTAEFTVGVNYVEYLITLPWYKKTQDNLDINWAEKILNENHYGLKSVKERILEYLAVRKLRLERKYQILVVDDDETARNNLQHILKKEDYEVATASNAIDALRLLETVEFDVILTDLRMKDIDGMELLEKIKCKYPEMQVIMITAYATIPSAVEAIKKGAYHYIAKPFQLEEVRNTVREALERKFLQQEIKGPILCFVGPPGTGKTSLGKSIAQALGRKFIRISLAGMKDEAEIRGHPRTYVAALPGRIIREIRRAGTINPVFMLDEVDKIGQDFKGDPASALLEVLDPEQNASFTDYYLDVPFDLSKVMFITTANITDPIPDPLLDRMEILPFSGYTDEEKEKIAFQFIIPRQIKENGLSKNPPRFTTDAVYKIIREYTYEAGVRSLEREIASICRKIARKIVKNNNISKKDFNIDSQLVEKYLGPRKFYHEVAQAKDRIGVTTGLVWTEVGGDIIFVEATKMKGKRELILTGSLGNVMRESAQAALSYVRSNAELFGIPPDFFDYHDIHIHVPAGAIPKDGPSAGITIALALISLLTGRPARRDVGMSGELTLSGRVLPVAGIREKILAARRAGVKIVILPSKNKVDVEDLPESIRKDLNIILIDKIEDIVDLVLR